jgi:hypothetical protein
MNNTKITKSTKNREDAIAVFFGKCLSWMMHAVIVVSSLGLLAGCASTTQRVPVAIGVLKADQSRVCVYCISGMGGLPAKISDGDSVIGNLGDHGYICWDRAPGKIVIRAIRPHGRGIWGASKAELPLDLIGEQTYYVQAGMCVPWYVVVSAAAGQAATTFSLVSRPQQEAVADIARECKSPEGSAANGK